MHWEGFKAFQGQDNERGVGANGLASPLRDLCRLTAAARVLFLMRPYEPRNWRVRITIYGGVTSFRARLRGFTLLELLVVMVIIGLLASYVAPRYFDQVGKSEVKATRAQLDAFEKSLGAYRLDVGHYPTSGQGLKALVERPADEPKWSGPYLSKNVPVDPWGRPYIYRSPGDGSHDFELMSLGKDGQPGGNGLDADISVWDTGR
jgi:general secretion pathway protein G